MYINTYLASNGRVHEYPASTDVAAYVNRWRCLVCSLLVTVCLAWPGRRCRVPNSPSSWAGYVALVVFMVAYSLVILEENIHLQKSKPVIVAAGIIWVLVAITYAGAGDTHSAEVALEHNLLEFAELFLFLLAAMTYINTMEERGVFDVLRAWLVTRGFSLRQIFWITGAIAFLLVADCR